MLYDFKTLEEYDKFIAQYINGAFSTFDMEALVPEVQKLKEGQTYLEVGVDQGKSLTVALFAAGEGVNVVGVDLEDRPERQEYFRKLGLTKYATFIHGESSNVAKVWKGGIDVLFIDGDHTYSGCLSDIRSWRPFVNPGGVILFHDCDETSPGVVQAVNESFPGKIYLYKTPTKNTSMAKVIC